MKTMKQKGTENMLSVKNTTRKSIWLAWVILSVGLIATIVTTIYVKMDVEADAKREFVFACDQIQLWIDARMAAHEQILMGAAALFDASEEITREEWHAYTRRQKVEQLFPGIQGIGFSLMVPREQLEQHIQEIRSQGFPDYKVKPEGNREIYTAIIYLEPFSWRNRRAFGYDMLSESVRRKAMEQAMDLDMAALSGKVLLVQEIDQDIQAGTLMYVPVYRKGMATDTVANRRAALYGWVYSPYRMNELMQGILKGWDLEIKKQIRLQIFDTGQLSADSLLYDSQPKGEMETVGAPRLTLQTHTAFNDHFWYLLFTQTGGQYEYGRVYGVLFGGTIITLLLFGLFSSILNTRFRVYRLANQLTVDLRESEEKYRGIFAAESDAVFLIDKETGAIIEANNAVCDIYGYTQEELMRLKNHDLSAEPEKTIHATKELKKTIPLRYHKKKDGTIFPVDISASSFVLKGRYVILAAIRDITKRAMREKMLQQNEERLRLSLAGGDLGMWDWNVVSGELMFNERWATMLGYALDELGPTVTTWGTLIHPDDKLHVMEVLNAHLEGKIDLYKTEHRLRHKSGNWIWVLDSGRVIERDVQGNALRVCGTHLNITERKRAEEVQEKLQKELLKARKLESIGTLAGGIAHDFNNLLYVVMGNISLAQDDLKHEIGTSANLKEAEKACIKAKELTARLITFSKGGDPVRKINSIDGLLKNIVASTLSGSNITPKISISDDIRQVNIDEDQIKQAVRNIVVNAREAMDDKGQLKVSCENVDIAEEGYLTLSQGKYIKISFTDQGSGISKENLEKIFDPYFSTKAMGVDKGQGLGLTVSYSIIQKHGGLITVESELEAGSTFSVYLPGLSAKEPDLQKSEEKPAAQKPVRQPATGTGKILLMDDDEAIRTFLGRVINRLGYDVEICIEGKEAIEIYKKAMESKEPFDVVILDLTNKIGMGGQDTMKRLLEIDHNAKGIVITGYSDNPVVANFSAYGFSGSLTKPTTRDELCKVINEVLSKDQFALQQ